MKKLLLVTLVGMGFIIPQSDVRADNVGSAAATILLVSGAVVATHVSFFESILAVDLEDWKNTQTGETAKLVRQCGILGEVRLIGNHRVNGVFLGLKNTTSEDKLIKPAEIRAKFSDGKERLVGFVENTPPTELKASWRVLGVAPLPAKSDFKHQSSVEIQIPIHDKSGKEECVLSAFIQRDPSVPENPETSVEFTRFDLGIGFGAPLFKLGNMKNLVSGFPMDLDLDMYFYSSIRHGYFLTIMMNGFGGGSYSQAFPFTGALTDQNPAFTGYGLVFGYSYRNALGDRSMLSFDIGPELYYFGYQTAAGRTYSSAFLSAFGRVNYDYTFSRVKGGIFHGDYSVGVSLAETWLPTGSISSVNVDGHSLDLLFRFKMAY